MGESHRGWQCPQCKLRRALDPSPAPWQVPPWLSGPSNITVVFQNNGPSSAAWLASRVTPHFVKLTPCSVPVILSTCHSSDSAVTFQILPQGPEQMTHIWAVCHHPAALSASESRAQVLLFSKASWVVTPTRARGHAV